MSRGPRSTAAWVLALAASVGPAAAQTPPDGPAIRLAEVSAAWGVDFRHHHGGSGRRYMVETMGGGVVIFDYDGDGDPDLLFVDGGVLPGYQGEAPRSRLFRNDGGRFAEATGSAGIEVTGYGSGGAAGDVDGDGDLDLYVTALGPNLLFVNRGDGTFVEAAAAAGVDDPLWGTSAAFADPDRDGDLDLYVANYVDFTVETHRPCETAEHEVYCHPGAYPGQPDRYFRNRGDGTFEEAAEAAGLAVPTPLAGLGVLFGDVDLDGWPDLYVANDAVPNFLFRNRGDGTFSEQGLMSGTAFGEAGRPEAGMGIDLGDTDGDGLPDLVVTNFELETNVLYRNVGDGLFLDLRYATNLAEPSKFDLAFGVALVDLDHDADLDLAIANGHILDNAAAFHSKSRYAQPNRLMANDGGRFSTVAGGGFDLARVSRGLAAGDLDGDGDLDLAVVNSNDLAEVWENLGGAPGGRWLQVDLDGRASDRFGIGARIEVETGRRRQAREVRTGGSYQSQSALTAHFGLAAAAAVDRLEVSWPSGRRQRLEGLPVDRRLRLVEPPAPPKPAG